GPDWDESVHLRVEALYARQVQLDQLARGDLAGAKQLGQAGDAGEGEIVARWRGRLGRTPRRGGHDRTLQSDSRRFCFAHTSGSIVGPSLAAASDDHRARRPAPAPRPLPGAETRARAARGRRDWMSSGASVTTARCCSFDTPPPRPLQERQNRSWTLALRADRLPEVCKHAAPEFGELRDSHHAT